MPEVLERTERAFQISDRVLRARPPAGLRCPRVGMQGRVVSPRSGRSVMVRFDDGHESNCFVDTLEHVDPLPEPAREKPFYLVALKGGREEEALPGETFDVGKQAGDRAKLLTVEMGRKVQVRQRKAADPDAWRARERQRMEDGTYTLLPEAWNLEPIADHFLHLSSTKKGMLAYTESPDKGERDLQTPIKPGAYAKRFYPHLDEKEVGRLSALVSCDGQLMFADTAEEMRRVYMRGPDSCMSGSFGELPCHPAEVYAAGDLAVAYLEDDDNRIIARCVVWPEKKLFTRAYGDIEKIVSQLEAAGFKRGNHFGARIRHVEYGDCFVLPYIDECHSKCGDPACLCVTWKDGNLVISDRGYLANDTDGYIYGDGDDDCYAETSENQTVCDSCEDRVHEDDVFPVRTRYGTRDWC